MEHILETDSINLSFGANNILSDVYLKVNTGQVVGILGRNGSGKSCLMNIIYGELKPDSRSIRINGKIFLEAFKHSDIIKYLPQFNFIPKSLTLKRIFKDFKLDYNELIDFFQDSEIYYNKPLRRLSGGLIRLIELYVILKSRSEFCMLDEPFSHLMPVQIEIAKKMISQEKKKKGILITDHMYDHIIEISDRIYLIKNGKTHIVKQVQDIEDLGYANIRSGYSNLNKTLI